MPTEAQARGASDTETQSWGDQEEARHENLDAVERVEQRRGLAKLFFGRVFRLDGYSTRVKNDALADINLCVLVAGGADAHAFSRLVTDLVAAGVRMLQIRDKVLSDTALVDRVGAALAIARTASPGSSPLVIVNDRVRVAAEAGADGVHLGATDMPLEEARRLLGDDRIIGRTAHDIDEARRAIADGADYLGAGPCFPSTTKTFVTHAPRAFLAEVALLPVPVFAIGGITVERLDELRALGIQRVAVAAAITSARAPADAARDFLASL